MFDGTDLPSCFMVIAIIIIIATSSYRTHSYLIHSSLDHLSPHPNSTSISAAVSTGITNVSNRQDTQLQVGNRAGPFPTVRIGPALFPAYSSRGPDGANKHTVTDKTS